MKPTIEQRPASQILIHHPVLSTKLVLGRAAKAVVGIDPQHLADLAALDQVPDLNAKREVPCPDSLHEKQVLLSGCLSQNPCLLRIHSECLFAEHMLSCFQDEHDILEVVRVRGCDVDGVDIWVRGEGLVGAVRGTWGWNPCVCDEFLCTRS